MNPRAATVAAALALPLLLTGCTSDASSEATPGPTGTAPVVQLGAPGEPNRTVGADDLDDLTTTAEASESDIAFVRDMVPHHEQALAMTSLVGSNDASADVKLLAERMEISQRDEVAQLQAWLEEQGPLPPDDHSRHGGDHAALMPGMLTDEQMAALAAAKGSAFDELFLTSMIAHHTGAIAMVSDLFSRPDGGQDLWVAQFARHVDSDQRVEVARMTSMLAAS
jgi:uncharacterized protein (DUF305 family)